MPGQLRSPRDTTRNLLEETGERLIITGRSDRKKARDVVEWGEHELQYQYNSGETNRPLFANIDKCAHMYETETND